MRACEAVVDVGTFLLISVSSTDCLMLLIALFVSLLAVGEDWPQLSSSSSPSVRKGLSSMISVSLFFLLELIVEVDVELVSRAILSRVMSFGVEVSRRKSLSRKKFRIDCRWTCALA